MKLFNSTTALITATIAFVAISEQARAETDPAVRATADLREQEWAWKFNADAEKAGSPTRATDRRAFLPRCAEMQVAGKYRCKLRIDLKEKGVATGYCKADGIVVVGLDGPVAKKRLRNKICVL